MIVDSNIFIYSLLPQYKELQEFLLNDINQFQASAITRLEVAGFHRLAADEKQYFDDLFSIIQVFPIDEKTILNAIELRRQRKRSLADSDHCGYGADTFDAGADQQRGRFCRHRWLAGHPAHRRAEHMTYPLCPF